MCFKFCARGGIASLVHLSEYGFPAFFRLYGLGRKRRFVLMSGEKNENSRWYAAKAASASLKRIKSFLVDNGVEHFMPFVETCVERDGRRVKVQRPLVANYVFIHGTPAVCMSLSSEYGLPLSFLRNREAGGLLVVPPKQMEDFIQLYDFSERSFMILNQNLKTGDKVRIVRGELSGIEGELIRIKGHKRVVVRLEGLFSLAVSTYLPKEYIERI